MSSVTRRRLIFVPTYNEHGNVERMVRALAALPIEADLLFMDDCSPDGTGDILDRLAGQFPRLHVIHRSGKLGIGSAHLAGIQWAYENEYDDLVTLDCDFTHSPTDVIRLIENSYGYDVTVGSRYMEKDSLPGWNLVRRSLTGFGHLLTRDVLGIHVDATGALRAYDLRRIPQEVFNRVNARGYGFFFESMFVMFRAGFRINEIPIVLPARTYGSSKMTVRETVRSGSQLLSLWMTSTIHPHRYRPFTSVPESGVEVDGAEGWNAYWNQKDRPSNKIYDAIATRYRVAVIKRQLERFVNDSFAEGSHLLHAGCGSGQVDADLHRRMQITAVDISEAALRLYKRNNPSAFDVRYGDILSLPFSSASFDGVYNLGVLEHFDQQELSLILAELHRVLKPGGRLLIFWPHVRGTSVAALGLAHWVMNSISSEKVSFHPPEVSLLRSRGWAESLLNAAGFRLERYYFGPRDFFVQAVLVAQKATASD